MEGEVDLHNQDYEEFEDALESQPANAVAEMTLTKSLQESNQALHLFLNNLFQESEKLLKVWSDKSLYHATCLGIYRFTQAGMTSDPRDVEVAIADVNSALNICSSHRRKRKWMVDDSVTKLLRRPDYDLYTEEEAHAELCYCEMLMMKAALIFISDASIISYIRAGLHIHAAFHAFKNCQDLLEYRNWTDENSKLHFEAGVLFISGATNLFFASLPSSYLPILRFVGISASLEVAFQKLERGNQLKAYVRGPLCTFLLLTYISILKYSLGNGSADTSYCKSLIEPDLKLHPEGAIYLFFFGRLEVLNGNFEEAIELLLRSTTSQDRWRQLKHLCYWDLSLCNLLLESNRKAFSYFSILSHESHWAKAVTQYMCATMLMRCDDCTTDEQNTIDEIMRQVPSLSSKLSGKSIPIEKFFCSRAQRYNAEKRLFLSAEEMLYIWGYFSMIANNLQVIQQIYKRIDTALTELMKTKNNCNRYYWEDYCLGSMLKGVCLRYMNKPLLAEESFNEVLNNEANLKEDIHLPISALTELGYMHKDLTDFVKAINYFELARSLSGNGRKKMAMRSRNQYRIHSGLTEAKKLLANSVHKLNQV